MKRILIIAAALTAAGTAYAAASAEAPADAKVTLKAPTALKVKQSAELSVVIEPPKGWKVSTEAPMSVKLSNGGKVILGKRKLGIKDGSKAGKGYVLKTTVAGGSAGGDTVKADATYFMCTDDVCKRFTASRELALEVK